MKAELIFTGTELLLGQILNTNSQYLSQRLSELGVDLYYHSTVGDNPKRLRDQLEIALKRSDLIITTGGLGPTMDDLTKETVAEALGLEMTLDEESLKNIQEFFIQRGKKLSEMSEISENNKKQAYFPQKAKVLPNKTGTAPGAIVKHENKVIIILPGPPWEMRPMFEDQVEPWLKAKISGKGQVLISRVLRLYGIGESLLEEKIKDLIVTQKNPTIAPLFKGGEVNLRITAKEDSHDKVNKLIDETEAKIRAKLDDYIFGVDNESLEKVVGKMLSEQGKTISAAESCTGGLISSKLTDVSGSSAYYMYGLVTYSNEAKIKQLGLSEETLKDYGAVSRQTAQEMALGVREIGQTDIGVAVTGIAGPGGGTKEKPVGLVYIGLAIDNEWEVKEFRFAGDRELVKILTVNAALNMLRKKLLLL